MDSLYNRIVRLFRSGKNSRPADTFDADEIINQIRNREQQRKIEPGRRIHEKHFQGLDLFLDLDITETYRITVNRGRERIYSFSVFCGQGDYGELKKAYERVAAFLKSDRDMGSLPDDDHLKGFYYGGG